MTCRGPKRGNGFPHHSHNAYGPGSEPHEMGTYVPPGVCVRRSRWQRLRVALKRFLSEMARVHAERYGTRPRFYRDDPPIF